MSLVYCHAICISFLAYNEILFVDFVYNSYFLQLLVVNLLQ